MCLFGRVINLSAKKLCTGGLKLKNERNKKIFRKLLCVALAAVTLGAYVGTTLPQYTGTGIVANAYNSETGEENGFQYIDNGKEIWITKYVNSKSDVVIPSVINGKPVTIISFYAFRNTNIKSVVIPDSVKDIMSYAFASCKELRSVDLGNGVEGIGKCAFSECFALTEITIPYSMKDIGDGAFAGCESLKKVIIPDTVENILIGVFYGCDECTIYGKKVLMLNSTQKIMIFPLKLLMM